VAFTLFSHKTDEAHVMCTLHSTGL